MNRQQQQPGMTRRPGDFGQHRARLTRSTSVVLPSLALIWVGAGSAYAQSAPPRSVAAGKLEEVTVTATRRSEAIAKVPVAITAFNAKSLDAQVITHETDLQSAVPGLTVKTTGSQNQINYSIRGESIDAFSGSAPGVLAYLNDVAQSSQTATTFYDLANIQVLKGPQGTLFGRNDTGGAILYNTVQPGNTMSGYVTIRAGSYGLAEYQGAVTIPIVPGILSLRLAGDITGESGYVKNLNGGGTLGDTDAKSGRATLKYTPNAQITSTTVFQYSSYGGTELVPALYSYYAVGQTNHGIPLNDTAAAIYGNATLAQELALQKGHGPYQETLPYTPYHRSHEIYLANTSSYEVSPDLIFKNILSIQNQVTVSDDPLSGAANGVLDLATSLTNTDGNHFNIDQYSEEFQIQGNAFDESLKYIGGFYAANESDITNIPVTVGITLPHPIQQFHYDYSNIDRTYAVYAQATYDLSKLTSIQGLSATVGGRETWDYLTLGQLSQSLFTGAPDQSMHEQLPSWNLGLQYQVDRALLLYFVNRGSWRAGNFNGTTSPVNNQDAFNAETVHDFEVGTKFNGSIWGRATQFDFAGFYQIVNNEQHDIYLLLNGAPASFAHNVPKARVEGIETDGQILATDWLTLGGAAAYTEAYFPNGNVNLFGHNLIFQKYEDTPRWTLSAFTQATLPTPDIWGPMTLRADVYYQSSMSFSSLEESIAPGTLLPAYALVNLRYDWGHIFGSRASFAVYAKNLLNRAYYIGGFALGPDVGFNSAEIGPPQTFGVELNYTF